MKKILYYLIFPSLFLLGVSSCSDDDCDELHDGDIQDIPNIIKGTFPTDKLTPEVGEEIVYAPELFNATGVDFEWTINGQTVMDEDTGEPYSGSTYTYKVEKPCRAKIGFNLKKNNATVSVESEIVSLPDLTAGFIVLQSNRELGIYDQKADKFYSDCYGALNAGAKLAGSSSSDAIIATSLNDKLYLMTKTSTSNVNHLAVCDLATLSLETTQQLAANLINFIPLNDRYVLVNSTYDLYRLDLRTYHLTKLVRPGKAIYSAAVYNGKLLTNTTVSSNSSMFYFDVETLLNASSEDAYTATEMEDITQNKKSSIVIGKDGMAYTVGSSGNVDKLLTIDNGFTTESIDLSFTTVKANSSALYYPTLVASPTENAIFVPTATHEIYKYVIGNPASLESPFIAAPGEDAKLYGSGVVLHPDGSIYAIYSNYTETDKYTIVIYNAEGTKVKEVGCGDTAPQTILFHK